MQSPCGVRIDAPELLTAVFVATGDRLTQAALALSSRAWAAVSRGCRRLTVRFDLDAAARAFKYGPQLPAQLVAPTGDLAGLAAWLTEQQRALQQGGGMITGLDLSVADENWWGTRPGGSLLAGAEARSTAQVQARQAIAVVGGCLEHLKLFSGVDAAWLPPLPFLTRLDLCFARRRRFHENAAGKEVPLAWLAELGRLPRLRELKLRTSFYAGPDYFDTLEWEAPSLGPALPPAVTRLEIEGVVRGMRHVVSQLHSLEWAPGECGTSWSLTRRMGRMLCQATQLTSLNLVCFWPEDASHFFRHLARATQLCALELDGYTGRLGIASFLCPEAFPDQEHRIKAQASCGAALAALTNLTCLMLPNMELSSAPGTILLGLATLPSLAELDVASNHQGSAGALHELPFGPYQSTLRSLTIDEFVAAAALAQPGHALWSMPALTELKLWGHAGEARLTVSSYEQKNARLADLKTALQPRLPQGAEIKLQP